MRSAAPARQREALAEALQRNDHRNLSRPLESLRPIGNATDNGKYLARAARARGQPHRLSRGETDSTSGYVNFLTHCDRLVDTIMPGDKLGPYEVLAPIGAGGMGEVYKAGDTRLCRGLARKKRNHGV